MNDQNATNLASQRFGRYAAGYVTASVFSDNDQLARLIEIAEPQPHWRVLDIATGGGHTALAFASHVREVIASDLTLPMLSVARDHIHSTAVANVHYTAAEAAALPFAAESFDLVTCRIAPHHFPDVYRFMLASARVLRPGGIMLVQDHVVPDKRRVAHYADAFERLRDPSHVRTLTESEWQGVYLDVGLEVTHTEQFIRRHDLIPWAERQGCEADVIERLQVMLLRAPDAVARWMQPELAGTDHASFCNHNIIIAGRKPA